MSENTREQDKDPEPIKHSDAERVTSQDTDGAAREIEEDPAQNPGDRALKDIKGG